MSPASPPDAPPLGPAGRARAGAARQAGFTLVEVLVAVAVTAAALAAIGLVVASNARATRALERRAALLETARAVEAGLPPRRQLKEGRTDGAIGGHAWRVDVRPLDMGEVPSDVKFVPHHVLIRVRGPDGAMVELETVRLAPVGGAPDAAAGVPPGEAPGARP
ncbi:prepilin-type N-terminal cleavage/methylation domain-containing protein [Xanthobacter sp. V4C-4]|uniref:prepilin-type N-terminal cleavage/methylation domain-containing protein n=1 Tax=Xanthobacter cornucopiae TaxID=3119924 RepID=UPI00372ABE19